MKYIFILNTGRTDRRRIEEGQTEKKEQISEEQSEGQIKEEQTKRKTQLRRTDFVFCQSRNANRD